MASYKLCGARVRSDPARIRRCRLPGSGAGGRCRLHGGVSHPAYNVRNTKPMRLVVVAKQQLLRVWGIRWKDAIRPRTPREAIAIMANAIVKADAAIEMLPAPIDKPDDEKTAGELLNEGLHTGLILGREACKYAMRHLQQLEAAGVMVYGEDLKVLRWGTDTAGWLTRAGIRVVEGEFRARRDDVLGKLLEQIASAKGESAPTEK